MLLRSCEGGEVMGYYVTVEEDVNLFVEDVGPKDGKPILFIHGWPVNHRMFEYQLDFLPRMGFRCYAVDLRGYGKSDRPWEGYGYNRMADDIRAVIETLDLEYFTLAGFSMGGAISIRYMSRYSGDRVARLALFGAAAPRFSRQPDFPHGMPVEDINKLIEQTYQDRPQMVSSFGGIFFARYVTPSFQNWFHGLGLEAAGHATALGLIALRDEDLREDLAKIDVPTVIMHGMQDKVCPFSLAELMHAGIKGSELIPFRYSGHGLFYCEQDKFLKELVRFIRQ